MAVDRRRALERACGVQKVDHVTFHPRQLSCFSDNQGGDNASSTRLMHETRSSQCHRTPLLRNCPSSVCAASSVAVICDMSESLWYMYDRVKTVHVGTNNQSIPK